MEGYIPQKIASFFFESKLHADLDDCKIFVSRADGVLIYDQLEELEKMQIGALVGGVWQGAKELANYIPGTEEKEEFKWSFETGMRGVYILPLVIEKKEYFYGGIYYNAINPGLVKYRLKELQGQLKRGLVEKMALGEKEKTEEDKEIKKAEELLFNNISDREMDDLFSSIE